LIVAVHGLTSLFKESNIYLRRKALRLYGNQFWSVASLIQLILVSTRAERILLKRNWPTHKRIWKIGPS